VSAFSRHCRNRRKHMLISNTEPSTTKSSGSIRNYTRIQVVTGLLTHVSGGSCLDRPQGVKLHSHTNRQRHPFILRLTQITHRPLLNLPLQRLLTLRRLSQTLHTSKDAQLRHQSNNKNRSCQGAMQAVGERQVQLFRTVEVDGVWLVEVFRVARCGCNVKK
jgi:hypothetical protein